VVGTITRCRDWLPPTWANTVLASKQSNRHWNRRQASLTSPRPPRPRPSWPVFQRRVPVPPASIPISIRQPNLRPLSAVGTGIHWGRRGRQSERKRETHCIHTPTHRHRQLFCSTHTPTHRHTHGNHHPHQPYNRHPSLYGRLHCIPWFSRCISSKPPTCFLTPHSTLSGRHPLSCTARTRPAREQPPSSLHTPRQPIGDAQEWDATSALVVGPILKPPTLRALSHPPPPPAETLQNAIATSRARANTRCCDTTPFVHARRNIEPTILLHVT
jgi:hypothetical protein